MTDPPFYRRDIVVSVEKSLPGNLKRCFSEVLSPQLVSILQQNLQPLGDLGAGQDGLADGRHAVVMTEMKERRGLIHSVETQIPVCQETIIRSQEDILSKFRKQDTKLADAVEDIKAHITSATSALQSGQTDITEMLARHTICTEEEIRMKGLEKSFESLHLVNPLQQARESLQEVYVLHTELL